MSAGSTPPSPPPQPSDSGNSERDRTDSTGAAERNARFEATFGVVLERPPEQRESFLREVCGTDTELRERVQTLLAAHENAGSFFEEVGNAELEWEFGRLKPEESGNRIGPYTLAEKIGEGGFGVVWKAQQERPVKRLVALKIIKVGMATKDVIARFDQERQALALMDHPNIAKVFDAGATQYGRPYFAMELVEGSKITAYCDQLAVPLSGRLDLFMDVCRAVQHAHQKGIIHRDLKPSNVLIAVQDGKPVSKVIDFGVAKAVQQRLTDLTIFTDVQQLIGTPLYMSPEQADMDGLNIDTRTDIYALGVMLYELLTGCTPFDRSSLLTVGYDEMRRIIREEQPRRPSAALAGLERQVTVQIAARRGTEAGRLAHQIRGDLDCIVMKCLEKERSRRYETANALLLDIERSIRREPIRARPPSRVYQFSRLVRRNRLSFSAAAAVALSLVTALILTSRSRSSEAAQRKVAEQRSQQARESETAMERLLYASDMNLAQDALRVNNLRRARMLLDAHRPKSGKEDLRGWEWRYLWQLCRSKATHTLHSHSSRVLSLTFSADGARVAGFFGDGAIKVWNVRDRKLIFETDAEEILMNGAKAQGLLRFSPVGNILALATPTGVNLYEMDQHGVCTSVDLGGPVSGFAFSPDAKFLVCRTPAKANLAALEFDYPALTTVDLATKKLLPNAEDMVSAPGEGHGGLEFSLQDSRIFTTMRVNRSSAVVVFSEERRRAENVLARGESDNPLAMDLSPDQRTLVVGTGPERSVIQLLDAESSRLKATLDTHSAYIAEFAFSPARQLLASASGDQTIRLWHTGNWSEAAVLRGHGAEVLSVAFSPDGKWLASGDRDGQVFLWDNNTMAGSTPRFDFPSGVKHVRPQPGQASRAIVLRDGKTYIWSVPDFHEIGRAPADQIAPHEPIKSARRSRSRDGRWVASPEANGVVKLVDTFESRESYLQGHLLAVTGLSFSPNGLRLATTSSGSEAAKIWDPRIGRELLNLPGHGINLTYSYWTDDGDILIVNSTAAGHSQAWVAPSFQQIAAEEAARGRWPATHRPPILVGPNPVNISDPPDYAKIDLRRTILEDVVKDFEARLHVLECGNFPLSTEDSLRAHSIGALHAWAGRDREYTELCRRMLTMDPGKTAIGVRSRLGKLYCLRASPEPEVLKEAIDHGRNAASLADGPGIPWHELTLGMALYRNDEFQNAISILAHAEKEAQSVADQQAVVATACFVQAMCQYKLAGVDSARLYFHRGLEKMKRYPEDPANPMADATVNDLTAWIMCREASALLGINLNEL